MENPSLSIQTVWWIASKEHQTSIMWSCHIINLAQTVENTQKNMRIIFDLWFFWDIKNSTLCNTIQLGKIWSPDKVDVIIISHVHSDHTGNLVSFVKKWYNGPIYMSHINQPLFAATAYDSLSIFKKQIREIEKQNTKLWKRLDHALSLVFDISSHKKSKKQHSKFGKEKNHDIPEDNTHEIEQARRFLAEHNVVTNDDIIKAMKPVPELLFDEVDIRKTMSQIQSQDWKKTFPLSWAHNDVHAKFYEAGHLEWAAQTVLSFQYDPSDKKAKYNLLYTWDLGRIKEPLLLDKPSRIHEKIDTTIIESTYGNRIHAPREWELESLVDEIATAESAVVIVAFSNWRTPDGVFVLREAIKKSLLLLKEWEHIYIDGKLTKDVIDVLLMSNDPRYAFLADPSIKIIENDEDRKAMLAIPWRKIIFASGGMFQWWTSLTHTHKALLDPKAKIISLGYLAEWTRWAYLKKNAKWWLVYRYDRYKEIKDELYSKDYTLDKIKERKWQVRISWQSARELENIILDFYENKDILNLKKDEYIYVSDALRSAQTGQKEILNREGISFTPKKYWPYYTVEKAEDKLMRFNSEVYRYFKSKIRTIESASEEGESIDLNALQWVVIYQDKVGKIKFNAKMINYTTFSGHADRDELLQVLEETRQHPKHHTLLVHGDEDATLEFSQHIEKNKKIKWTVIRSQLYDVLTIDCKKNTII